MLRPHNGERVDCPDSGLAVVLAGAQLECDEPKAYYEAADNLNIFHANVSTARQRATVEHLICHGPDFNERLTLEGRKFVAQTPPANFAEVAELMGSLVTHTLYT